MGIVPGILERAVAQPREPRARQAVGQEGWEKAKRERAEGGRCVGVEQRVRECRRDGCLCGSWSVFVGCFLLGLREVEWRREGGSVKGREIMGKGMYLLSSQYYSQHTPRTLP